MKKAISILLVLVMAVSLCACGKPKTVEAACEQADKLIAQWNSEAFANCSYRGEYDANSDGGPYYWIYAQFSSNESTYHVAKAAVSQMLLANVYPELAKLFENFDLCVAIVLSDNEGNNTYCGIIDGEIEYFD